MKNFMQKDLSNAVIIVNSTRASVVTQLQNQILHFVQDDNFKSVIPSARLCEKSDYVQDMVRNFI